VHLGQFPADDRRAVGTVRAPELRQGRGEPARGLEEHLRASVGRQFGEPPFPLARLAWRESLEAEPVRGQAGDGERRGHRGRAWHRGNPDARRRGRGDEPVAGVADARHPGVGDHEHVLARLELGHQFRGSACLDDVVIRDHARGEPHIERRGQAAGPAGILGRYNIGDFEFRGQPGRGVLDSADGDGCKCQNAGAGLTCAYLFVIMFGLASAPHPGFPPHSMAFDDRDSGRPAGHGTRGQRRWRR